MKLIHIFALAGFLLALENAIPACRKSTPVSKDPVFSLPMMETAMKTPGKFQRSIDVYKADRGGEWNHTRSDGTRLTVFYFEWDRVQMGPIMSLAGHSPDECNVAAGYTLKEILPPRFHDVPGQPPLVFDATHFTDPAGRNVHMFKMPWIQGLGARKLREGTERTQRLQNSFLHHKGAARVLQAGIFDAHDPDHAWQIFQSEVLDNLKWTRSTR